jgi:hypothetical protein
MKLNKLNLLTLAKLLCAASKLSICWFILVMALA